MKNVGLAERIAIVQRTRKVGADGLVTAIGMVDARMSERAICNRWLTEMRRDSALLSDGWYLPPPNGLSVLIGHPDDFNRMNYVSLRDQDIWPRDDIELRDDSLLYADASPTDRTTGLIGDLGLTLYRGSNRAIWEHLSSCLEISSKTANYAEVGMELRELFHYAQQLIREASLDNRTSSRTDAGATNIGHTIPWTDGDYSIEAQRCIDSQDTTRMVDLIKNQRIFLNDSTRLRIEPTMAFTVEPRMASATLPLCSYHLIVTFLNGERGIHSEFRPLFQLFGMEEYLPQDTMASVQ